MSRATRVALIALGVVLLLPGVCSALSIPFVIGLFPALFTEKRDEFAYAVGLLSAWGVGAIVGLGGLWLLTKARR